MVKLTLRRDGIPIEVLRGKVKKFRSVHVIFRKVLYETMMTMLHESFFVRAFGGTDQFGESWVPIKNATQVIKNDKHRNMEINQPYMSGEFSNKRELSPDLLKRFKKNLAKLKNDKRSARQKGRIALSQITYTPPEVEVTGRMLNPLTGKKERKASTEVMIKTPTNIRYGRLASAYSPAEISNNRIYTGPFQKIEIDGLNFRFEIVNLQSIEPESMSKNPETGKMEGFEYAKEGPDGIAPVEGPWTDENGEGEIYRYLINVDGGHSEIPVKANDIAIRAARQEYDRILGMEERSATNRRNSSSPRDRGGGTSKRVQNPRRPTR